MAVIGAFWVYREAKSRDASPQVWAVAVVMGAIFLGQFGVPLVLILYLILMPKGRLRACPHCGRNYLEILAFCPHCGKPVKKECLRCHENIDIDAKECPHCRMRVS